MAKKKYAKKIIVSKEVSQHAPSGLGFFLIWERVIPQSSQGVPIKFPPNSQHVP
jgi:hypothetical protein